MLYLAADNTLYWPNSDMTIGAFRAYFLLSTASGPASGVRAFVLNFGDGEETAIGAQPDLDSQSSLHNSDWYTIDGRKLSGNPTKAGLYIVNGKKIVK